MNWIAYRTGSEYATGNEPWSGWYIREEEGETHTGPFYNEEEARQAADRRNTHKST